MVVKITPEASAGSIFNLFKVKGITIPAIPAIIKFNIIAIAITPPSKLSENQYADRIPIKIAKIIPFIPPTKVSLVIIFITFDVVSSLTAIALTETVSVYVPALPPIEATIGIKTAKATTFSIEA